MRVLLRVWMENVECAMANIHNFLSPELRIGFWNVLAAPKHENFTRICLLAIECFHQVTLLDIVMKHVN